MRKCKSFYRDGRDGRDGSEDIMILGDDDRQRVGCRHRRQMREEGGRKEMKSGVFFCIAEI